jgi:pimeloyl-ACP methyl ester carboxylesterase
MRIYRIAKSEDILGKLCSVSVKDVPLHGLLYPNSGKSICIFIHGTASNFYAEDWIVPLARSLKNEGVAMLTCNNRGSDGLKIYPMSGAAVELFEDCLDDIDEWIAFAKDEGYTKISLVGHSLGSEKVVYYMNNGRHVEDVEAVVLAGFSDTFGCELNYAGGSIDKLLQEAKKMEKEGDGDKFINSDWLCHDGVLPQSAKSFINFFSKNSELSKAFTLRDGNLEMFSKIDVPILATISNGHEYTSMKTSDAIVLLEKCNKNVTVKIVGDDHSYAGSEDEIAKTIAEFVAKVTVTAGS